MNIQEAKLKIQELVEQIEYHNKRYYELDSPVISDYEYDMLYRELESLEFAFPELVRENSPTKKIGGNTHLDFKAVEHKVVMRSLQDCFSFDEMRNFDKKLRDKVSDAEYVVEPKIDGLSVSLEYKNGVLFRASTRGNGTIGEDITDNIRAMNSVTKILNENVPFLEVRGEVYMSERNFMSLLEEQELNGKKAFKNPRNAAAGSLRQKDPEITAKRNLDIFIFNIQQIEGKNFSSHIESLEYLKKLGLNVVPSFELCSNIEEVISEIKKIGDERCRNDFPIDGAVVKLNDFERREILGDTSKYPRWAQAFKYPPEEKETKLLQIEVNVGRTGTLTPIGVFEEVLLAGTTVNRASLHNESYIREKDIRIGDTVLLRKAGEIIPEVVCSLEHEENSVPYEMPKACPSCNSPVKKEEDLAAIKCINSECPAQFLRKLIHFVSRDAMDINGLGESILKQLVENKQISSFSDIYKLKQEDLSELGRMGEKSAENVMKAIELSKNIELSNFIYALGINHVGLANAKILAKEFKTLDKIRNVRAEELENIDGLGKIISKSIEDFFSLKRNQEIIDQMLEFGVSVKDLEDTSSETKLKSLSFVLTGTLPTLKRSDAKSIIENNGGKVVSSVSKNVDYVLAGENPGSKLEKAKAYNIKIIDEKYFWELVNGHL